MAFLFFSRRVTVTVISELIVFSITAHADVVPRAVKLKRSGLTVQEGDGAGGGRGVCACNEDSGRVK